MDRAVREVARIRLPTPFATFDAHAFQTPPGTVHLALVIGDVRDGPPVLARVHSECLTGDALGSLRCDCGIQLRAGLRAIAAEGRGVLIYVTGHEGRGIGLVNKLRAYVEQDRGSDTVDANLHLGLPVDSRRYGEAAEVLGALGIQRVKLITNNPRKVLGLEEAGIAVDEVRGLPVAARLENVSYLRTKQLRMGHAAPLGDPLVEEGEIPPDVTELLGRVHPRPDRPYVVAKYAQSVDGRIATARGDSKWISGLPERVITHALRARCDAVMVGVGTVLADDPQLTVRFVPGASPLRVILDSSLRTPLHSRVLVDDAPTMIVTTERSRRRARESLKEKGVAVRAVRASPEGVDVPAALQLLARVGIRSLLVEGGAGVITSLFGAGAVDRVVLGIAPLLLGRGVEAVGELGIEHVHGAVTLENRSVYLVGRDLMVAWDVAGNGRPSGDIAGAPASARDDAAQSPAPPG